MNGQIQVKTKKSVSDVPPETRDIKVETWVNHFDENGSCIVGGDVNGSFAYSPNQYTWLTVNVTCRADIHCKSGEYDAAREALMATLSSDVCNVAVLVAKMWEATTHDIKKVLEENYGKKRN
jgi:hypothetical protein